MSGRQARGQGGASPADSAQSVIAQAVIAQSTLAQQPDQRLSPAELAESPLEQLEELVIFSEWRRLKSSSRRSLTRTRQLMQLLGYNPRISGHSILGVLGSKGKGTTAAYASAALSAAGKKTGAVTSPGVISNADRIRINGQHVDPVLRRNALMAISQAQRKLPQATAQSGYLAPTGLFLLQAMLIFQDQGCEVVVAEAGMGGASDDVSSWPVNTVALTQIFGEHRDVLGPEISDIARDKAAVITEATHCCVTAAQSPEVAAIISEQAAHTRLLSPDPQLAQFLPEHLEPGFAADNALLGLTAAMAHLRTQSDGGKGGPGEFDSGEDHLGGVGSAEHHPGENALGVSRASTLDPKLTHQVDARPEFRDRLREVLASVHHPGRLSLHHFPGQHGVGIRDPGPAQCLVDSPVNRAGLRAAIAAAQSALGGVEEVYVCIPPEKDLSGFIAELEQLSARKVFVNIPDAYIAMPQRSEWPWEWIDIADLPQQWGNSRTVIAGTVLFTSAVLRELGVESRRIFSL